MPATASSDLKALRTEIHVWLAATDAPDAAARLDDYAAMLDTDELARCHRFRFERDRRLYLVAHALVRRALSHYAHADPSDWRFARGAHGRPEIAAPVLPVCLRFNLSHTRGLAACVVTLDQDCGIDVESVGARRNMPAIAARMFAAPEQRDLQSLQGRAGYAERFFTYWTLREAWCKARGTGLADADRATWFERRGDRDVVLHAAGGSGAGDWQCASLQPTTGHRLAVVVRRVGRTERPVVCRELTP